MPLNKRHSIIFYYRVLRSGLENKTHTINCFTVLVKDTLNTNQGTTTHKVHFVKTLYLKLFMFGSVRTENRGVTRLQSPPGVPLYSHGQKKCNLKLRFFSPCLYSDAHVGGCSLSAFSKTRTWIAWGKVKSWNTSSVCNNGISWKLTWWAYGSTWLAWGKPSCSTLTLSVWLDWPGRFPKFGHHTRTQQECRLHVLLAGGKMCIRHTEKQVQCHFKRQEDY